MCILYLCIYFLYLQLNIVAGFTPHNFLSYSQGFLDWFAVKRKCQSFFFLSFFFILIILFSFYLFNDRALQYKVNICAFSILYIYIIHIHTCNIYIYTLQSGVQMFILTIKNFLCVNIHFYLIFFFKYKNSSLQ